MKIDNDEEMFEQIEAFLMGTLTGEDLERFKKMLVEDTELAREVEQQQLLVQAATDYHLKQQIKNIHRQAMVEYHRERYLRRIAGYSGVLMAGLLLFSGLLAGWLYSPADQLSEEISQLLNAEDVDAVPCGAVRSAGAVEAPMDITLQMVRAYSQCEFKLCVQLYELNPLPSIEAAFYGGNAYLVAGDQQKARAAFLRVIEYSKNQVDELNDYRSFAEWYVVITDLKNNKPELAEAMVKRVRKSDPANKYRRTLEWHLLEYYLAHDQVAKADALLDGMDDADGMLKARVKLLRWKQNIF